MDLMQYTLGSLSVAATLFSLVLIATLIVGAIVTSKIMRLLRQLEAMGSAGAEAAEAVKDFATKMAERLNHLVDAFVTVKGAREIVEHVGEAVRGVRDKSKQHRERSERGQQSE